MRVILTNMCLNLAGLLEPALGYFLVKRGDNFYSIRSKWGAPPDGHWRFIVLCAELAQNHLYISDIEVTVGELDEALEEATNGRLQSPWAPHDAVVNADKVLQLKSELGL